MSMVTADRRSAGSAEFPAPGIVATGRRARVRIGIEGRPGRTLPPRAAVAGAA